MREILLLALLIALPACSGGGGGEEEKKKEPAAEPLPPTVTESNLREFTGARTKIVWAQLQNTDKVDKQGTSRHHYLYAIDTNDGRGAHKVLETQGNYAYPIITPDGEHIVFTRKERITKGNLRTFKPTIEIIDFDGGGLRTLGKGYAQEVWEDPETGKFWIYAGDGFVLARGTAPICSRIIRFPLDDPSKRETVWDRTQMGTDSFAISADGKRFAGLFPWPKAGIGNLETLDWEPLTNGCWVAMAPDNSYRSWVFDGSHKNFFMFDGAGKRAATINVNSHPDLSGQEVYHPRWGNHPRFFVLSGPHSSGKKRNRGKVVEIFLGKFSPEFDRVESWFKVTDDSLPDIYPDIWVEGVSRSAIADTVDPPPVAPVAEKWPGNTDGLLFKWENVQAKNEFTAPDGSNQVTKTEPKGMARYGRHYEMDLSGGIFAPVLESGALLAGSAKSNQPFGFQGFVTVNSESGTIFEVGAKSLQYNDGWLSFYDGLIGAEALAKIERGVPTHITISCDDGGISSYVNGAPAGEYNADGFGDIDETPPLVFGGGLDGTLENIAFYNRPITAEEAAADYAIIKAKIDQRKPVEQLKVKGKLVAMSPLPSLDNIAPYVRALVYYAYETDHPEHKNIAVTHWAILDKKPVGGLARELGKTYDLVLEPFFDRPELSSQAESRDEDAIDITLTLFHDVTTPTP